MAKHGALLRASVTSEAGGINLCPNGQPTSDLGLWTTSSGGGPDTPTLDYVAATDLPQTNPIDGSLGAGHVTWTGPDTGSAFPPSLVIPNNGALSIGNEYTASIWVYVPSGSNGVTLLCDGVVGTDSLTLKDQWVRLSVTFTSDSTEPAMALWADTPDTLTAGMEFYFTGCLIQPGTLLGVYTNGGGQEGDPVQILVDGSDTPVTANGLTGYIPTPGDRLLVQRVGSQMEVVQWISRGTVPYVVGSDLSDLASQVDVNTSQIAGNTTYASGINDTLTNYMSSTDTTISGLQGAYDALTGIGNVGVQEDYIWVGDDPALSTVKTVQISTYVQGGLYAGDYATFSTYFNLWDKDDLGDVSFSGTADPPMTTFYNVFTANGLSAMPWNS